MDQVVTPFAQLPKTEPVDCQTVGGINLIVPKMDDATGWTANDRTGRTAGHPYVRYVVPATAAVSAGAGYVKTAAQTYMSWRTFVPGQARKAADDARTVYQSVVGQTADEQMYRNEDKGTVPSKAVVQHNQSETKKGVMQDSNRTA